MESMIRNVKDIEAGERQVYERVFGRELHDNQLVIVRLVVPGVEPDPAVRDQALAEAAEVARQGRAHAAAQGVSEEEADRVIDETIHDVRAQKHS